MSGLGVQCECSFNPVNRAPHGYDIKSTGHVAKLFVGGEEALGGFNNFEPFPMGYCFGTGSA